MPARDERDAYEEARAVVRNRARRPVGEAASVLHARTRRRRHVDDEQDASGRIRVDEGAHMNARWSSIGEVGLDAPAHRGAHEAGLRRAAHRVGEQVAGEERECDVGRECEPRARREGRTRALGGLGAEPPARGERQRDRRRLPRELQPRVVHRVRRGRSREVVARRLDQSPVSRPPMLHAGRRSHRSVRDRGAEVHGCIGAREQLRPRRLPDRGACPQRRRAKIDPLARKNRRRPAGSLLLGARQPTVHAELGPRPQERHRREGDREPTSE